MLVSYGFSGFMLSGKPQYYILAVVCYFGIHRPIRTVSRFCSFKFGDRRAITLGGGRSILLSYGDIYEKMQYLQGFLAFCVLHFLFVQCVLINKLTILLIVFPVFE